MRRMMKTMMAQQGFWRTEESSEMEDKESRKESESEASDAEDDASQHA